MVSRDNKEEKSSDAPGFYYQTVVDTAYRCHTCSKIFTYRSLSDDADVDKVYTKYCYGCLAVTQQSVTSIKIMRVKVNKTY